MYTNLQSDGSFISEGGQTIKSPGSVLPWILLANCPGIQMSLWRSEGYLKFFMVGCDFRKSTPCSFGGNHIIRLYVILLLAKGTSTTGHNITGPRNCLSVEPATPFIEKLTAVYWKLWRAAKMVSKRSRKDRRPRCNETDGKSWEKQQETSFKNLNITGDRNWR